MMQNIGLMLWPIFPVKLYVCSPVGKQQPRISNISHDNEYKSSSLLYFSLLINYLKTKHILEMSHLLT